MKQKKVLIILTGLAAAGTAIYFIFREDQSRVGGFVRKVESTIKGEVLMENGLDDVLNIQKQPVSTSTNGCSGYGAESFPLKKCMKGTKVKNVQTILNTLYKAKIGTQLTVDGYFGPATEAALYKAAGKRQLTKDEYNSLASAATAKANVEEPS